MRLIGFPRLGLLSVILLRFTVECCGVPKFVLFFLSVPLRFVRFPLSPAPYPPFNLISVSPIGSSLDWSFVFFSTIRFAGAAPFFFRINTMPSAKGQWGFVDAARYIFLLLFVLFSFRSGLSVHPHSPRDRRLACRSFRSCRPSHRGNETNHALLCTSHYHNKKKEEISMDSPTAAFLRFSFVSVRRRGFHGKRTVGGTKKAIGGARWRPRPIEMVPAHLHALTIKLYDNTIVAW